MNKPFDVFFKENNPERCQLCCLDMGTIHGHGTYMPIQMKCPLCDGTGVSDAPLFTDEDSIDFDAWCEKRGETNE